MSKIICDVCGTSYPETSTQCPICGCVRPADAQGVTGDTPEATGAGTYNYVKGGRFSKANVRKRNRSNQQSEHSEEYESYEDYTDASSQSETDEEPKKGNTGLVITAVVLLLAIVAVVIYIALKFFLPALPDSTEPTGTSDTTGTSQTSEPEVTCMDITLDVTEITLDAVGSARMLYATPVPADAVEEITYTSSDETVVTVTNNGKITAVGPGEAVVTVTCGSATAKCTVICDFEEPTEDTTEETTEATEDTTVPDEELRLNRSDITFSNKGDSWMLYSGKIAKSQITWSSDDETVATIENGTVVAVGSGTTKVHAEYNGEKVSCIIRCAFSDGSSNQGVSGSGGGVSEDGGGATSGGAYRLYNPQGGSSSDVSIKVGESFTLQFVDGSGNYVSGVTWSVSDANCCSVSSGGVVKGLASGTATVIATYQGVEYRCIVRVGT